MILQDHLVRNTHNELPQELLNPQAPHLFLQKQHTRTSKLAEAITSNFSKLQR